NQKEAVPIQRNMAATTQAYGLKNVDYLPYNPGSANPTAASFQTDLGTVPNARVLDPNVLSSTFTQQQRERNVFGFPSKLNIDRYTINGTNQDYIVAAREINPDNLTASQQDWINKHLVYTHGEGFVAAPANQVAGGYPNYVVSDLNNNGDGAIKVSQPRIYYGLMDPDYAVVGGTAGQASREYDTDSSRYTYNGSGGVSLSSFFNRLVFSMYYGQRNFLFSDAI